ncbi:MAG: hypothetical protein AAFQ94_15445 [Bacteroidota bacterium]
MNTKTLALRKITLLLIITCSIYLFNCTEKKPDTNAPKDSDHRVPTDQPKFSYQIFNLELAAEEAFQIRQNLSKSRNTCSIRDEASISAINALRDPCDFNCQVFDMECLQQKFDCGNTVLMMKRADSDDDDDDGDGAEPLPIASDTSLYLFSNLAELTVYSEEPQKTRFELRTDDGELYASSDDSPDQLIYDERNRHVVFKISGKKPEAEMRQLIIYVKSVIVNAEGKDRSIEFKHTVKLASDR